MRLLKECEFFTEKSSACNKNCAHFEEKFWKCHSSLFLFDASAPGMHGTHHRFLQRLFTRKIIYCDSQKYSYLPQV